MNSNWWNKTFVVWDFVEDITMKRSAKAKCVHPVITRGRQARHGDAIYLCSHSRISHKGMETEEQ